MHFVPSLIGKICDERKITSAPGFPKMGKTHYFRLLEDLHLTLKPSVYFEIGTESGASLNLAQCTSIAVDPKFQVEADVARNKPELHMMQSTSDDFFASGLLDRLAYKIDLAFLDGLHLFEYLLRDFINTEKYMQPSGTILMHDCVPFNVVTQKREWNRRETSSWTGDVWKLIPILREFRPDLKLTVFDTPPSGIVQVTDLDPSSRVLEEEFDLILQRYAEIGIEEFGLDRFAQSAAIQSYQRHPTVHQMAQPLSFRIQTAVPVKRFEPHWGDHAYAASLAKALTRAGHKAEIKCAEDWEAPGDSETIDLVLKGDLPYQRREGHLTLIWPLYFDDFGACVDNLIQADHVFAAGKPFLDEVSKIFGEESVSLLPQAFDSDIMHVPGSDAERQGAAFVGLSKRNRRPIVRQAFRAALPLKLWGRGWQRTPMADAFQGVRLPNEDLGRVYAASEVVLNDHRRDMSLYGIPSNRIFDALSCATPVISDLVSWLPEDIAPFVYQVSNPREMKAAYEQLQAESPERVAERRALADAMKHTHSFDARAATIVTTVLALGRESAQRGVAA